MVLYNGAIKTKEGIKLYRRIDIRKYSTDMINSTGAIGKWLKDSVTEANIKSIMLVEEERLKMKRENN